MKIPGLILALIMISIVSTAQIERKPVPAKLQDSVTTGPARKDAGKTRMKDILNDLDLTKEQRIKLKEIRQSAMAKKEAIENNSQLSEKEKKMQLRALQKEQAQSVQAILTDEQKEKFKAKLQEISQDDN